MVFFYSGSVFVNVHTEKYFAQWPQSERQEESEKRDENRIIGLEITFDGPKHPLRMNLFRTDRHTILFFFGA